MPKVAKHVLTWSPERNVYELRGLKGANELSSLGGEDQQWFAWLSTLSSFSFQGQHGNLTLRKEARTSGEGYWYAYRSQRQQTFKRYAGRTADLTIARLEEIARTLAATMPSGLDAPNKVEHVLDPIVPTSDSSRLGMSRDLQEPIFGMVPISSSKQQAACQE